MNSQKNQDTTQIASPLSLSSVGGFLRETIAEAKAIILPPPKVVGTQFVIVLVLSTLIVAVLYLVNMLFISVITDIKSTNNNAKQFQHSKLR